MRTNQVSIRLERFSDKEDIGLDRLTIDAYADSNNVYEALTAAYFEVLEKLQKDGEISLPSLGRRETYPAHSFAQVQIFKDFLRKTNTEDKFRNFKKNEPTLQEKFLVEEKLQEKFAMYLAQRDEENLR